jgi:hypothetical protein
VQLNSRPNNKLQFDEQGGEATELGQPILYYLNDDKIIVLAKTFSKTINNIKKNCFRVIRHTLYLISFHRFNITHIYIYI